MNNFPLMWAIWQGHDPLTIYFRGTGAQFAKFIDNLVEDFNAPREFDEDEHGNLSEDDVAGLMGIEPYR